MVRELEVVPDRPDMGYTFRIRGLEIIRRTTTSLRQQSPVYRQRQKLEESCSSKRIRQTLCVVSPFLQARRFRLMAVCILVESMKKYSGQLLSKPIRVGVPLTSKLVGIRRREWFWEIVIAISLFEISNQLIHH